MSMKKFLLMPFFLVAVTGCQLFQEGSDEDTYVNAEHGFTFEHAPEWKVESASQPESAMNIIAWVYTPQAMATLEACRKANAKSDWNVKCGPAQSDAAIGIYGDAFIDYPALDVNDQWNYPNYKKLTNQGLGGFS